MNFNSYLKEAIVKGSARTMRKPLAALRHDVAALKRQVAALRRAARDLQRVAGQQAAVQGPDASAVELKRKRRPTGAGIRAMRAKLGMTQTQFAKLLNVSALSVSKWERAKGSVTVRTRTLVALRKVRGLGKREALKALQG